MFTLRKFNTHSQRSLSIFFIVALFFVVSMPSFAQSYVRLTPFSDLYCVYLPNGKTQIATATKRGYKKISFDNARDQSAKTKAALRNTQKKVSAVIKELIKQRSAGNTVGSLSKSQIKAIVDYSNGSTTTGDISNLIASLEQSVSGIQAEIEFQNTERNLIKNCEQRKLPPLGSMEITYEALIAEDKSSEFARWRGIGLVFMSAPTYELPGVAGNALCLTFQNGVKRLVSFTSDPAGAYDSLLSYASNNILVTSGETSRLLPRDGNNRVTKLGYVVTGFAESSSSKRESVEQSYKSRVSEVMTIWGTSANVVRATFNKKLNKFVCLNFG